MQSAHGHVDWHVVSGTRSCRLSSQSEGQHLRMDFIIHAAEEPAPKTHQRARLSFAATNYAPLLGLSAGWAEKCAAAWGSFFGRVENCGFPSVCLAAMTAETGDDSQGCGRPCDIMCVHAHTRFVTR
jgi:hypothetical protein